jgi:regulator of RNase E activity RraB
MMATSSNENKRRTTKFQWETPKIKLGDKIKICYDSMCECISGCGCVDAETEQVVKIWNNEKCKYDKYHLPEAQAKELFDNYHDDNEYEYTE